METKKNFSRILRMKNGNKKTSKGVKNTATVFAVSVLALLALGIFTTSQRVNAG